MLVVAVVGALITTLIGLRYAGEREASAVDTVIEDVLVGAVGSGDLAWLLVMPSEPQVVLPLAALLATVCLVQRRWRGAAFAAAAPLLAVALNTWVLKPAFGRLAEGHLAYPSGHTVSIVAVSAVLVLLARPGVARWVAAVVGAAVSLGVGVALVTLDFHYPTDVLGGIAFALTVVPLVALALRRFGSEVGTRDSEGAIHAD
ncbi:phosphatase PAP2 family protein [Haloechinothrix halophila]|uniref:phosphatase PAP2 family protein n=1 Tax=Haloechinothrix halophila TaxID=1069073 RepID=UPI0004166979|nr:phosphatase PAP2 family protein [Haloechinothrix halophila]